MGLLIIGLSPAQAQESTPVSLEQAINAAIQNNRLIKIKEYQILEKKAKVKEDAVKKYPSVTVNSTYQYNANVGELVIPQGSFGQLPLSSPNIIQLPNESKSFQMGEHNIFNAGVSIYQPITQQAKIRTGIELDKTDVQIIEAEKRNAVQQISQAVEKLYYGLLINQKQQEEAKYKLDVANIKLYDVESALIAKRTIDANKAGLQASIADEEQNILKLKIQEEDYLADLKHLTGLNTASFYVVPVITKIAPAGTMDAYKSTAEQMNVDIQVAILGETKAKLGVKAAKQSTLPDLGLVAGYTYQIGNIIFPETNPFAGVNLSWNIQDVFSNKQVYQQRTAQLAQARENVANTKEQVNNELEKTYRKVGQSEALIRVAQKAVAYRREEEKVQQDRRTAGLNTPADLLNVRSTLAKAEADLFAAELNYRLSLSDLKRIQGGAL
jgi:outer membrane protein